MSRRRMVLIANPGHKRVAMFQAALERCGQPLAYVISYRDLLDRCGSFDWSSVLDAGTLLRIESPAQDFDVEKRLWLWGGRDEETTSLETAERGRMRQPRQWFCGFARLMNKLADLSPCRFMNHPHDIVTMFDKPRCQRLLAEAGIRVPMVLGSVGSFEELQERMRRLNRRRVFVKLAYGSSASGIVALATNGRQWLATTTVEMVRENGSLKLYNSRRIRRYELLAEITALIDALTAEGVHVEEWIPKAGTQGKAFDLRVMMVAGEPGHIVARLSDSPMTNLHLLNRRGDLNLLRGEIPSSSWEAAMDSCRRAAALFPRTLYVGIDLMFAPGFRRHAILELNAFGDLLPGVLWNGMDTYEAEIRSILDTCSTSTP